MNDKNGVVKEAVPGAGSSAVLTEVQVKDMLKRDLSACVFMLDAIYKDQDIVDLLAQVMHGKYMNARHKAELDLQSKVPQS